MVSSFARAPQQLPLLHIVERDDIYLAEHAEVTWFHVLRAVDWRKWVPVAAQYYQALYIFNAEQARQHTERAERRAEVAPNPETRQQATLRLALDRPTEEGTGVALQAQGPGGRPSVARSVARAEARAEGGGRALSAPASWG